MHTWHGMLGYCQKDQFKDHYAFHQAGNIPQEDMDEGWRLYLMYGKGEIKNRGNLTPDNLLHKMSLWWSAKCGCDTDIDAVSVLQQMLQSGLYFPNMRWVMPTGGAGLDQERLECLFNVAKNFQETTRSDVRLIFMCPDHRYNDLHFEMAAQFPGATTLRPWQQEIVDKVSVDIIPGSGGERIVNWYHEDVGNVGKSYMSRFLSVFHNTLRINGCMKKDDMLHTLMRKMNSRVKAVVFDVPRSTSLRDDLKFDIYEVIEQLCDGHLSSGKYESNTLPIHPVHVIVFSNSKPRSGTMSRDRWNIRRIVAKDQGTVADDGFFEDADVSFDSQYTADALSDVMRDIANDQRRVEPEDVPEQSDDEPEAVPDAEPDADGILALPRARQQTPPPETNGTDPFTPEAGARKRRRP